MKLLQLLPIGPVNVSLLESLRRAIPLALPVACEISPRQFDPSAAYHSERQQHHSSELLMQMQSLVPPSYWRVLGITALDLYIPILQYVFGEAQMGGPCALVSFHRLRQQFYGLERDDSLLEQRLFKESIHELGHTCNLHHCYDYQCAMSSAHSVEWIDVRGSALCDSCRRSLPTAD